MFFVHDDGFGDCTTITSLHFSEKVGSDEHKKGDNKKPLKLADVRRMGELHLPEHLTK